MLALCPFDLRLHAGADRVAEHPQLHALAHQHPVHENGCIPFLWDIVVHKLREVNMGRDRQIVLIDSKAAVSLGVLDVLLRISGVRRTDIHDGAEGGSFCRSLLLLLDASKA